MGFQMNIVENILPKSHLKIITDQLRNEENMSWYYQGCTVDKKFSPLEWISADDNGQFTHAFVKDGEPISRLFNLAYPIILFVEKELGLSFNHYYRGKANMLLTTGSPVTNSIHRDNPMDGYTSILYYPFDCDGDTVFYDKDLNETQRVTPKENTAVVFNSTTLHASSNPIKYNNRIVLNFVMRNGI
jgi:hypothetical protein